MKKWIEFKETHYIIIQVTYVCYWKCFISSIEVVVDYTCVGSGSFALVAFRLDLQHCEWHLSSPPDHNVDVQVKLSSEFPAQFQQLNYVTITFGIFSLSAFMIHSFHFLHMSFWACLNPFTYSSMLNSFWMMYLFLELTFSKYFFELSVRRPNSVLGWITWHLVSSMTSID